MATPREDLATALKQARIDAGYKTHGALAKEMHVDRSVVTRAESATQPVPSDALLASWAGAAGADLEVLAGLAARCRSGSPEWFVPYLSAEQAATILRCWAPLVIPGLLQTEPYARGVLSVERYSPERLAELVTARMERQQVIGRARITAVIDVSVLQRCIGSPQVMADQLSHLVTVADRPDIALHVVTEGTNVGLWGAFDIAAKDGAATVNLTTIRDVSSTAPDLVDETMQSWELILGASMPLAESLDCLRSFEAKWKEQI